MNIEDLPPLREALAQHGLAAKKSFGQHFLLDLNVTRKIARLAGPLEGRAVIEVGPGPGGLTRALLEAGARVIAVEKDARFLPLLADLAGAADGRLTLVEADALEVDEAALLSDRRPYVREHAAWALSQGLPRLDAVGRLIAMVAAGGFSAMLAQRTLEGWSVPSGEVLAVALEAALVSADDPAARARLVETLGLVRAPLATRPLIAIARDEAEDDAVREAAIAALGQRPGHPGVESCY